MVVETLAILALIAFCAAAVMFISDVLSEQSRTESVARMILVGAVLSGSGAVAARVAIDGLSAVGSAGFLFGVLALIMTVAFLLVRRRFAVRSVGALVSPLGALLMAAYLLAPVRATSDEPAETLLTLIHVGMAMVGIGSFALAALLSILYIVQDRQLRNRNFGRLFRGLPSLEALDAASFRLVVLGFVVYTVALVVGFFWLTRAGGVGSAIKLTPAILAWGIFAAVIHTRVTTGWRGSKAAMMTVLGCVSTLLVLAGYMVKGMGT